MGKPVSERLWEEFYVRWGLLHWQISPSYETSTNVQWNRSADLVFQPQPPKMSMKKLLLLILHIAKQLLTSPGSLGQQDGFALDREASPFPKWFPQHRGTQIVLMDNMVQTHRYMSAFPNQQGTSPYWDKAQWDTDLKTGSSKGSAPNLGSSNGFATHPSI